MKIPRVRKHDLARVANRLEIPLDPAFLQADNVEPRSRLACRFGMGREVFGDGGNARGAVL